MQIIYKKGNLLESDEKIILHGCNTLRVMGAGIAAQIREKYPEAYRQYVDSDLKLGQIVWVETQGVTIGNCITQQTIGSDDKVHISYDALTRCMLRVNRKFGRHKGLHIAMPMIGAGLGGGDWNTIEQIIQYCLTDVQPIVYRL